MFEQIIGNQKIREQLTQAIQNQKTSHSYLFVGTEGIGKKEMAKEFAKSILCLQGPMYCHTCKSCIEFDTENNPDFQMIEPDGNTIKIEQIRDMQKKVVEKPIIATKKIYIINDGDKMTKEAQNCLLKTLEEPPEYVTIILVGTNENAFLSTIKSRCTILRFQDIPEEELKQFLAKKNIALQDDALLKLCGGSIGKALQVQEKQEEYMQLCDMLTHLKQKDIIEIFKQAQNIFQQERYTKYG